MPAYLKIDNPGVCPPSGFTVLGISLADTSSHNRIVGLYGSGNNHAITTLLRHDLAPTVFSGTLRMEFSTRLEVVRDELASKEFRRIVVKYGGTDQDGIHRSNSEELNQVTAYGQKDWGDVDLALREFVSNAIDRCIREDGNWSRAKIEVVDESQVRAKRGHTRVFVPMNAEVLDFFNNLGRWFLHFGEPEALDKAILPKRDRNFRNRKAAVIYRRGVRVREFESSDVESLFDYNLTNLPIDESRRCSDWDVRHHCGRALAGASRDILVRLFNRLVTCRDPVWEFEFDSYSLQPNYQDGLEETVRRQQVWQEAFEAAAGEDAVMSGEGATDRLVRKGYTPVTAPQNFVQAAERYGVRTPATVLSTDEIFGRDVTEATPDVMAAVDLVWGWLEEVGLTNGKQKPEVKCFTSILDGGVMLNGYYRNNTVFVNSSLAGSAIETSGERGLPDVLVKVALEELVHHVSQATDNSRDFQDFLLDLVVKLARSRNIEFDVTGCHTR